MYLFQLILISFKNIYLSIITWLYSFKIIHFILIGIVAGSFITTLIAQLLFFSSDMTWAGVFVDLIDKLISIGDKFVGYKVPELGLETEKVSNFSKIFNFTKHLLIYTFVGGLAVYSGFFVIGVTFGLNKALLSLVLAPFVYGATPKPHEIIYLEPYPDFSDWF